MIRIKSFKKRIAHIFSAAVLIIGQVILPTSAAFADSNNQPQNPYGGGSGGTSQPVWCMITGYGWTAQLGGSNTNRWALTQLPAGASSKLTIDPASGQVYAPDSSDWTLKGQLDQYCAAQFTIAAPVSVSVCGPNNDTVTAGSNMTISSDSGWHNNSRTVTYMATTPYTFFSNGKYKTGVTVTYTDKSEACPETVIQVPAKPNPIDPCGLDNATWSGAVPADTSSIHWALVNGDLYAYAKTGHVFYDGSYEYNFGKATDSGALCPTDKPTVTRTVVCGPTNDTFQVTGGANYTYSSSWQGDNLVVSVNAKANYEFGNGVTSYNVNFTDDNTACPIPVPTPPEQVDPCGLDNAYWVLPADTDTVHWYVSNGHLYASVIGNYVFTDGYTTHDYGTATDKSVMCNQNVPKMPDYTDPCDDAYEVNKPYWTETPQNTSQYTWKLNWDKSYTVTATAGNMFRLPNGMLVHSFTYKLPYNNPKNVCYTKIHMPKAPEPDYTCGPTRTAEWILPQKHEDDYIQQDDHMGYNYNNDHSDSDKYYWKVIKGELWLFAKDGYVFEDHGHLVTKKNFGYASEHVTYQPCIIDTPSYTATEVCGPENDLVTPDEGKHYSVKMSSWEDGVMTISYKADRGFEFANGQKNFSVTYTDENNACPVLVAPTFDDMSCDVNDTTSYTIPEGGDNFMYTVQVGDGMEVEVNAGTYNLARVNQTITIRAYNFDSEEPVGVWTHTFTIPVCTVGMGSQKPAATTTAQELPQTGPEDNTQYTLIGFALAAMTYFAVYFAQRKHA